MPLTPSPYMYVFGKYFCVSAQTTSTAAAFVCNYCVAIEQRIYQPQKCPQKKRNSRKGNRSGTEVQEGKRMEGMREMYPAV